MRRFVQRLALLAAAGLCLSVAACSNSGHIEARRPETGASLEGTVKYGKDTVLAALVIVQGPNGSATGFVGEDGRYKIQNAPLGEVNVAVNTDAGKGKMMSQMMSQSQGKAKGAPRIVGVPKKYFDPAKSGIKTTVNKGENTFDIVLPR